MLSIADSAPNLIQDEDIEEDILLGEIPEPGDDGGIGALALAQLGGDVGINQERRGTATRADEPL